MDVVFDTSIIQLFLDGFQLGGSLCCIPYIIGLVIGLVTGLINHA